MNNLNIGIIGSGMIAGVIVDAIRQSSNATIAGVTSRRYESAQAFATQHNIARVFTSTAQMLASGEVDAVYVATPTSVKEEIAIAAANVQKHLLVDKPFVSLASLERIVAAAKQNKVAFMDATHFTHHPRSKFLSGTGLESEIGSPQALRSSFFFPFMDKTNIRFDPSKEPTGAVGDMAWYSMRAITEYLKPETAVNKVSGSLVRDPETGAIIRGSGHIAFEDGKTSTFDFGYNAGVCVMDLDVLGQTGMIHMDDFVLDWHSGFAFNDATHKVGYVKRTAMQTPAEWQYKSTSSEKPQAVYLIENFASIARDPIGKAAQHSMALAIQTQALLEGYWQAVK
ncbi:Gfo/Idh/MocA family protein [Planctobacterium marinum]|uniref:Gfo/Idh/MocA family protein n=1 Tax=Planctobacterium marinum TaxID=1631968 RepID=UPI001E59FD36|nr:Gfo/Idh/MocA family oxidoreductase [Planctobacterium marinum]MCC2605079.1 Gfo/Idh/MocA family oxidoreductase [Planctobacterium marinum]